MRKAFHHGYGGMFKSVGEAGAKHFMLKNFKQVVHQNGTRLCEVDAMMDSSGCNGIEENRDIRGHTKTNAEKYKKDTNHLKMQDD